MASELPSPHPLVTEFGQLLTDFQKDSSKFRVLKTIDRNDPSPQHPRSPPGDQKPQTLFILDSSFNPPSVAHQTLVLSALQDALSISTPKPHRLLLLFATMNADKAPSPASFDERLTLMTAFAIDIAQTLKAQSGTLSPVPIDVGVTKVPYYTDKSAAIESEGSIWYPSNPKHVHLIGFDTLTRFFAAKYYQNFSPPFSALDPYFDRGHRLRVTLRPDDEYGSVADQEGFLKRLESGHMERDGGKRQWAKQIDLIPPNPKLGVSSTAIRQAAKRRDWEVVSELTTSSVGDWVQSERLYENDDRGAKMA